MQSSLWHRLLSPEYILFKVYADMAELADAMDLKSIDRNIVRVQVPLSAPENVLQ